ncbi:NADH-quinone oxidoreductase subunit L, partial [Halobacteriales archaeon SW_7_68_16]
LVVLGVLAAGTGFVNMVPVAKLAGAKIDYLHAWLDGPAGLGTAVHHYDALLKDVAGYAAADLSPLAPAGVSLGLALAGGLLARSLYARPDPVEHTDRLGRVKTVLASNYYLDEFQVWLAEGVTLRVARAANTVDQGVIDGVVDGVSSVSLFSGDRLRRIQDGIVTHYATFVTLGLVALLLIVGLTGGWFL